jgi:hypothetical protein
LWTDSVIHLFSKSVKIHSCTYQLRLMTASLHINLLHFTISVIKSLNDVLWKSFTMISSGDMWTLFPLKCAIFSKITIASFARPLLNNHLGDSEIKLMKNSKPVYYNIMWFYIVYNKNKYRVMLYYSFVINGFAYCSSTLLPQHVDTGSHLW